MASRASNGDCSKNPSSAHSREPSQSSVIARPILDKTTISSALDHIHTTASKSDHLTTFDEYASPRLGSGGEGKGLAGEVVQGGLSGLYSRIKASVGAAKDVVVASGSAGTANIPDDASISSGKPRFRATATGVVSSPTTAAGSTPATRLNSPSVGQFSESYTSMPAHGSSTVSPQSHTSAVFSSLPDREVSSNKVSLVESHTQGNSAQDLPTQNIHNNPNFQLLPRGPQNGNVVTGRDDRDVLQSYEMQRQQSDNGSAHMMYSGGMVDPDQTPRPDRQLLDVEPSSYTSRSSIASRDDEVSPEHQDTAVPTVGILSNGPRRPSMVHISQSHLPGFHASRTNSSDGDMSSAGTALKNPRRTTFETVEEHPPQTNDRPQSSNKSRMRSKILARELWMKDENAKDCFYCGDSFSAFRRKHHCRICGNIFDAKCTVLVEGRTFGQSGRLRICKPCEAIVYGTDDDSSDFSDELDKTFAEEHSFSSRTTTNFDQLSKYLPRLSTHTVYSVDDPIDIGTPSMGVPTSRKTGSEAKRRSAVIELDAEHSLARPSSSRSLKSLSGRPRSSSHKRHNSRHGHQHMRSIKSPDDRPPFHRADFDSAGPVLPAFHRDNIIDPDLAPFLSDEGSSEEEAPSIFAAMNSEPHSPGKADTDRAGLAGLLASVRRGKPWGVDKGPNALGVGRSDVDNTSITSRTHHSRRRNLSISSAQHVRNSPRRIKSNGLLKIPFAYAPSMNTSRHDKQTTSSSKMMRSAAMRGASAPVVELNQASLQHVRRLLRQILQDSQVPDIRKWEKALVPILLQSTDDVNPDIHRNDDIDIRHYIKLKKIPGGKPGDTSYVSGVVFSKNLAKKSMSRSISNPRIAIITFALEYTRHHQHFMSLDPVIAQEREYLRNLVKRILNLNAQLLLVEKNVAGLALEYLEAAGIAVIYNVKPSVLNAVARCTQTKLITSPEKLGMDPSHLGRCGSFDVKTYVHGAMKKTFIYLSGCQKDLGCTIVLRGAEINHLRKLKRITEFMCYVVYNLKLETCVMRDEYVLIPASLPSTRSLARKAAHQRDEASESDSNAPRDISTEDSNVTSAYPSPGITEKAPDMPVEPASDHAAARERRILEGIASIRQTHYSTAIVDKHKTKIISASPFVNFIPPYLLSQAREQEAKLEELKQLRDKYAPLDEDEKRGTEEGHFELVRPDMVHGLVQRPSRQVRDFLYAVHNARYEKALHSLQSQKRQWEHYLSGNASLLDPFNHQRIAFLYSMVNSKTSNPCFGPDVISLSFYNEHDLEEDFLSDITLGQYVEDLCQGASTTCTANGCDEAMFNHSRQYVHGEGQMSVIVQKYPAKIKGLHNTILMWSFCRLCSKETQVIPMSESTWKYSFGKYLELTFWSAPLHPRANLCPHDIHKDHIRYFGFNDVAIRIQYDPIQIHEIIVPRATITWNVDNDLQLKNEQYLRFKNRWDKFMSSVKTRIESIHIDSVAPEKMEDCKTEVERLNEKAHADHDDLIKSLQDRYMNSRYYELIPLNKAAKEMHESAIEWDDAFIEFEKNFFPSEKDIRRLAQIQINRFLDRDASTTSISSIEEGVESVLGELKESSDTVDSSTSPDLNRRMSTLSPEDTQNVLASVVKEEQLNEAEDSVLPKSAIPSEDTPGLAQGAFQAEAVQREDVKHLDLAVPSDLDTSQSALQKDLLTPVVSPTKGFIDDADISSSVGIQQPLAISPRVSQTVEDMREASGLPSGNTDDIDNTVLGQQESRLPRPVPSPTRADMKPASPPLIRTRSSPQPALLLRRQQSAYEQSAASSSSNLSIVSKTERLKNFIADPARALERRMGPGAFSRSARSVSRSLIPRSVPPPRNESRVLTLRHHFEQLSKEFEKQRMRERQLRVANGRQDRAYPFASSKPIVEVYRDAHEAVKEQDSADESEIASPRASVDSSRVDETTTTTASATGSDELPSSGTATTEEASPKEVNTRIDDTSFPTLGDDEAGDGSDTEQASVEDVEIAESGTETQQISPSDSSIDLQELKQEKTSLLKMLTSFWSERSASGWSPLEYPFHANEHVWGDSDIIVREDEPSSLIALALSSPDYREKVRQFRGSPGDSSEIRIEQSIEQNLLHPKNTNIRYAFQNRGVRAQCKIFYAESFDALRRKTGVAERFVESLSRCMKWDSKGGKTKSLFLKTLDDRFVLKSLSQVEVNAFFKFAPNYFAFMHQNLFHGLPSVIAKMMGLFQVTIRSPASGLEFNWFMLVMENLFYDRVPDRRFDLKGSMRNRKIESTGDQDEVLLDENLVDIIFEKPIFVREHTWKLLKASVWNDTLFLSKQNVMDYSLMAGFEDADKQIVVGIIDCIRTYTWDKKLETWIKDRGKNKPTVTSPKDYRNRFRIAMGKYILQAPGCWHQFQIQTTHGNSSASRERRLPEGEGSVRPGEEMWA